MRPAIIRYLPLLPVIAWLVLVAGCTSAYKEPGPPTVNDEEPNWDVDTAVHTPGQPEVDQLPDWNLRLAKTFGGPFWTTIHTLAATGPDTFVVGGHFEFWLVDDPPETMMFDGFEVPSASENAFWLKYHVDGKLLWGTWAGGDLTSAFNSDIDVDSVEGGRIATCGYCENKARFGPGEPNETMVLTTHSNHARVTSYFAVFESDGSLAWVRYFLIPAQASTSQCWSVELLEDGSVLAAGYFRFGAVASAGTSAETFLLQHPEVEPAANNLYLVKYDSNGELLWAKREGGPGSTHVVALAALADGAFFLSSVFGGVTVLGEGQANETTLVSAGEKSVFLALYDSAAGLQWAIDLGIDGISALPVAPPQPRLLSGGDVVVYGTFFGSMPEGDGDDLAPVFSGENGGLFLSRYTAAGEHVWTRVATTSGQSGAASSLMDITELHDETLVLSGSFRETLIFEQGKPAQKGLQVEELAARDAFLASYSSDGDFLWAMKQKSTDTASIWGVLRLPQDTPESDTLIAVGGFSGSAAFGTGPDDKVPLTTVYEGSRDSVILRFDREAN